MRLPSIRNLSENALESFKRFPFALASAIVATIAEIIIVDSGHSSSEFYQYLFNLSLVGFLGIPLFMSMQLIAESKNWKFSAAMLGKSLLFGILVLYYFLLPANIMETYSFHLIRYFLFLIAAHLFVAVGPFIDQGKVGDFWEFNKVLFLRFLTSLLYSSVLYSGLAIALLAIDQLFNANIESERYFQMWWLLAGIFNTWFFLGGVPKRLGSAVTESKYPKGLKIFTQYVMIPLVTVYILILYAYMAKIIVEWDWPKGWVGYLVICFSIVGIFSLLLIHPIKNQLKNKWMASIWRWFFYVLLPLSVLLLLAVWRRVSEYGITERRYFLIVLGIWLAAIALYFIISHTKNIKIIPLSLCIIALAVSFGPWGAFGVSERNQIGRLENVLLRNDMLVDGKIVKAGRDIPFYDAKRINSIIRYLSEVHGLSGIQPWFDMRLDTMVGSDQYSRHYRGNESTKKIVTAIGVRYMEEWETEENLYAMRSYSFRPGSPFVIEPRNYRYFIPSLSFTAYADSQEVFLAMERWTIVFEPETYSFIFTPAGNPASKFSIHMKMFAENLQKHYGANAYMSNAVPRDSMVLASTNKGTKVELYFEALQVATNKTGVKPSSATIDLLIKP